MNYNLRITIYFLLLANILYAQKPYLHYDHYDPVYNEKTKSYIDDLSKDSISLDSSLLKNYGNHFDTYLKKRSDLIIKLDLSEHLIKNFNNGFIGLDYQRFYIAFMNAYRNEDNPLNYNVTGKTRVKDNICDFTGTLTIDSFYVASRPPIKYDYSSDFATSVVFTKIYGRAAHDSLHSSFLPQEARNEISQYVNTQDQKDIHFTDNYYKFAKGIRLKYNGYQSKYDQIREDIYSRKYIFTQSVIFGHYSLPENPTQKHAGTFMGQFTFGLEIYYDSIHNKIIDTYESDEIIKNPDHINSWHFAGVWISNKNQINKTCCWPAEGQCPYSQKLCNSNMYGEGTYRNKGWDTYIDCRNTTGNRKKIACKKEQEDWWNLK